MRDAALAAVFTILAAAVAAACGGKAVIDAEPNGEGGSTTSLNTGGSPPGPTTGGGGAGGTPRCQVDSPFIDVFDVFGDQRFMAGGPGEPEGIPTANLIYDEGGRASLAVRGCAGNNSTNLCIDMFGPDLEFAGALTSEARVEYTSANGIVFIGDFMIMGLDVLEPVGQQIIGFFDGEVFASGGADSRVLSGSFGVCRSPDVVLP